MSSSPVVRKLRHGSDLSAGDALLIEDATAITRAVGGGADLILEGDSPDGVIMVIEGVLARYKQLLNGKRQIVALLLPGDFCDVNASLLRRMDHGISALGACKVVSVPRPTIRGWMDESVELKQAIEWAGQVDESILREWLVNLGARNAPERAAHFFCEIRRRMQTVQHVGESVAFPMSQADLGYALGLSVVHVNRTLTRLRQHGLARFASGRLTIADPDRLATFAGFTVGYLHLKTAEDSAQPPRAAA